MKRFLSVMLIIIFAVQAVACASSEEEKTVNEDTSVIIQTSEETSGAEECDIPITNYNSDFIITDGNEMCLIDYYYAEEAKADGLSDAIFERQLAIKDHIGVNIVWEGLGTWMNYSAKLINAVKSGDDHYQLLQTNVYQGVTDLIVKKALTDIADLPSVNLEKDYWAKELMDEITVDGKYFLGYNDYYLAFTHLIVYNKKMHENHQLENLYEAVNNKEWTLEKLMQTASVAGKDVGDGGYTTEDYYGITGWGWQHLIDFVTSSDLKIVDKDENGRFYISYEDNAEKMIKLVETMNQMYWADYTWFWPAIYSDDQVLEITSGRVLYQFVESFDLVSLRDSEVILGILPYPLFDSNQKEYKSLSWNGYLAVPCTVTNYDMVGDVLELLAYYAGPVKEAFYERLLGSKIANSPDDADMLEVIWKSVRTDVGLLSSGSSLSMDNLVYMVPTLCSKNTPTITSYINSNRKSAQKGLDKVFNN